MPPAGNQQAGEIMGTVNVLGVKIETRPADGGGLEGRDQQDGCWYDQHAIREMMDQQVDSARSAEQDARECVIAGGSLQDAFRIEARAKRCRKAAVRLAKFGAALVLAEMANTRD